jgi:hypothetical protein
VWVLCLYLQKFVSPRKVGIFECCFLYSDYGESEDFVTPGTFLEIDPFSSPF